MLFALASTLCWATLDALRKQLTGTMPLLALAAWLNVGFLPGFLVWAWAAGATWPEAGYWLPLLGSLSVGISAQLLYLVALKGSGLSVVIPMLALAPAMSAGFGWVALGEVPTATQTIGLTLVVVGCLANGLLGAGKLQVDRGAVAMAMVAMLWAANGVVDKIALGWAIPPLHAAFHTGFTVLVLLIVLAVRGELAGLVPPAEARRTLPLAMLTLGLAYGLQLMALQVVLVGLVEGLKRGVGMPLAMLNGWLFFGEAIGRRRLVAVGVIAVGVALLW